MNTTYETFMGRLGKNPELRYTPKSEPVCSLSVAVNKGKDEKPDWKRVVVWGKQAESCSVFLKKGNEVFVQGRVQTRRFKDREGTERTIEEYNARLVGFPNI